MDENIISQFSQMMVKDGVTGAVCTDLHGLILKEEGSVGPAQGGAISSIAFQAAKLFPDLNETPVITVEGHHKNCLIRHHDKIVLGIFKNR